MAVKRQLAQVTLAAPAAVAEAELGPYAWARVSLGAGTTAGGGAGKFIGGGPRSEGGAKQG